MPAPNTTGAGARIGCCTSDCLGDRHRFAGPRPAAAARRRQRSARLSAALRIRHVARAVHRRAASFHRLVSVSPGARRRRHFRRCGPHLGQRRRRQQRSGTAAGRGLRICGSAIRAPVSATYCTSISRFRSATSPASRNSNFWCRRCRASDGRAEGLRVLRGLATPRNEPEEADAHGEIEHPPPSCRAVFLSSGCARAGSICNVPLRLLTPRGLRHLKFHGPAPGRARSGVCSV